MRNLVCQPFIVSQYNKLNYAFRIPHSEFVLSLSEVQGKNNPSR